MAIKYKNQTVGKNGFSPTVDVTEIDGGHRVTIRDVIGPQSFNVMDGNQAETVQFDDTIIKMEDGTIGVMTPVQSILTQELFNALSEDEQNTGLYVVIDGENGNASSIVVNGQSAPFASWKSGSGHPDLAGFSKLSVKVVTLLADDWTNDEQTVTLSEISGDESLQLLTPVPTSDSFTHYYTADICLIAQSEGSLTFKAMRSIPTVDCNVYVYIQEVIEVEDVEPEVKYVWWSPKMTSDTTPIPYVASASDFVNNTTQPYMAFNNDNADRWASNTSSARWIQFDFGSPTVVGGISFTVPGLENGFDYSQAFPKKFKIFGTNDGIDYTLVFENDLNTETKPVAYIPKEYTFDPVQFSMYKFQVESGVTNWWSEYPNYIQIAEFQFYRPESEVTA